jgi:hypothetical protein
MYQLVLIVILLGLVIMTQQSASLAAKGQGMFNYNYPSYKNVDYRSVEANTDVHVNTKALLNTNDTATTNRDANATNTNYPSQQLAQRPLKSDSLSATSVSYYSTTSKQS